MKFRTIIIIVVLLFTTLCTTSFAPISPPQTFKQEVKIEHYEEEFLPETPPIQIQTVNTLTDEQIIFKIINNLQTNIGKHEVEEIAKLVIKYSNEYNLNPYWMLAIMYTESKFKNDTVSNKGARGLMQIVPSTAEFIGVPREKLHTPAVNVRAGFQYYKYLLDKYGNQRIATIAYNQGPGNVSRGTYRTWYHGRVEEAYNMIINEKQKIEEELR